MGNPSRGSTLHCRERCDNSFTRGSRRCPDRDVGLPLSVVCRATPAHRRASEAFDA